MPPVIHIGPLKTASTSLQLALLPRLGRPFQVSPQWTKRVSLGQAVGTLDLPDDLIVSSESLGGFAGAPPHIIAGRLAELVPPVSTIIYVQRDPVELFISFYWQHIISGFEHLRTNVAPGRLRAPMTCDTFFDYWHDLYEKRGVGVFTMARPEPIRTAFSGHFRFVEIPFELLRIDPQAFVKAFCDACGAAVPAPNFILPRENASAAAVLEPVLALASAMASATLLDQWRQAYLHPALSPDRTARLREVSAT